MVAAIQVKVMLVIASVLKKAPEFIVTKLPAMPDSDLVVVFFVVSKGSRMSSTAPPNPLATVLSAAPTKADLIEVWLASAKLETELPLANNS